ncbi:heme ABC exporter ATP-binding protein CcmA [Altericroceibacterium endophyticum]|uniref:Heme ABC exporter ATP-binding protein CcmA n=1 Tax=Altericroceibacterium endophyticum TaxID=1808508 RepID=A0A6I4T8V5_9SPHN|nr:heme ABC exporter ATP-binding protein CcmA [Altericroceibacterium endophyticum]MXO66473.1 heme ABC exporter ATP-binding protein CcmA [Altericroceibacterium endophyticum]
MNACRLAASNLACRKGDRLLFRRLDCAVEAGQALQITAPNGMGKSSLIRILAGLARPFAGAVERNGAAGLLDERPALDEHRPLSNALGFWRNLDGEQDQALQELGLKALMEVPVRYLSTGQRKRAAFARLMGQGAPIWLLDEPLNGLDTQAVTVCEAMVERHCNKGGIAIIASHQSMRISGMTELKLADFAVTSSSAEDPALSSESVI